MTFDEDEVFNKSRRHRVEEDLEEEPKALKSTVSDDEEHDQVDHDMVEPQMPMDLPKEFSHKRKPAWARELIQDAKRYGAPKGSLRESKRPCI